MTKKRQITKKTEILTLVGEATNGQKKSRCLYACLQTGKVEKSTMNLLEYITILEKRGGSVSLNKVGEILLTKIKKNS